MIDEICVECHKYFVSIKKWGLCKSCYQRKYRNGQIPGRGNKLTTIDLNSLKSTNAINKHEHLGELEFIKNFFNHQNWIAQPAQFNLNGVKYKPDFYDGERNVFIEVSRTRQAYSFNKYKYDLFRKVFPKLNFEIRKPTGKLLDKDMPLYPQLKQNPD